MDVEAEIQRKLRLLERMTDEQELKAFEEHLPKFQPEAVAQDKRLVNAIREKRVEIYRARIKDADRASYRRARA